MLLLGVAFFLLTRLLGGGRQIANATDSGALAAARSMETVAVPTASVAPEFQGLAIDPHTGAPSPTGIMNIFAYNRAAGTALLVALNAAEENSGGYSSPAAIAHANQVIQDLNDFGATLNRALLDAGQVDLTGSPNGSVAVSFRDYAAKNNTNMIGPQSHVNLDGGNLKFSSVLPEERAVGKSNVYFNTATYQNDPLLASWISQTVQTRGVVSDTNQPYKDGTYQANQPFIQAYQMLDISKITGIAGFASPIFACNVFPTQKPHLIGDQSFRNSLALPAGCYAPVNAVTGKTKSADPTAQNALVTGLASAVISSLYNEYPITMPRGYVRIHNLPDAVYAAAHGNPPQFLPSFSGSVDGSNNIFNKELWTGQGGTGPIWIAAGRTGIIFATELFESPVPSDVAPPGYSGLGELIAWSRYAASDGHHKHRDVYGHDKRLWPSRVLGYASPTNNLRSTIQFNHVATFPEVLGIGGIITSCATYNWDPTPQGECQEPNFDTYYGNYHNDGSGVASNPNGFQEGLPIGGLTDLENIKGQINAAWEDKAYRRGNFLASATFTAITPAYPSGSKLYKRDNSIPYAAPSPTLSSVAFGTLGTPLQLLQQLQEDGSSCINVNDPSQWQDRTTPLGLLLQRCQEISPNVAVSDIIALLNTYPIDLGEEQYIFLDQTTDRLTISRTPPYFLQGQPEASQPGATKPDGQPLPTCNDAAFDFSGKGSPNGSSLLGNILDAQVNVAGNGLGDNCLHDAPWTNWSGNIATQDGVMATPSSGEKNLLMELSFQNTASGAAQFSQPN
jgi:hypothetical protein